jgi:NADPH:quinone reductase-like Zn-dependent oxidoreductase
MRAAVLTRFGPPEVLQIQEVSTPTPKDHEVQIRIHATTVAAGDCTLRGLRIPIAVVGLVRPRPIILGQEFAGEITAIGSAVTRWRRGDQVFGWAGLHLGTYAEYLCLPETAGLAPKPSAMTFAEAATLAIGGMDAVHFLRKATVERGEKVLIVGAGGSIGTYAVQVARYFGAEVTGVDSGEKLDLLRALGADTVIDYTQTDFTRTGVIYDIIYDIAGKSPFGRSVHVLAPTGRYVINNAGPLRQLRGNWPTQRSHKRIIYWADSTASERADDIQLLTMLIESGKLHAVIDCTFPLADIATAHRYVGSGHKKGNVVITVA